MYYRNLHPADNIKLDLYKNDSAEIKEELESIRKYFNLFDELLLKERYELLSKFFEFNYDSEDVLFIANQFGKNVNRFVDIPSTIETWVPRKDSTKVGFNIVEDIVEEHYVCAANDEFIQEDRKYTSKELIDLTTSHIITPLYKYNKVIEDYTKNNEKPTRVNTFEDVGIKFNGVHDNYSVFDLEFDNYTKKYQYLLFCDENFNRIKEDIDRYLIEYVDELITYVNNQHNFDEEKQTVKKYSKNLRTKK